MRPVRKAIAGLIAAASAAAAFAQAPAPKASPAPKAAPAKAAPAAPAKGAPRAYYENYQASQRLRLRRETCMRDEDMVQQYCVKRCKPGFLTVNAGEAPRHCRSEKPLPEGQLPTGAPMEQKPLPAPARPAKPIPGA